MYLASWQVLLRCDADHLVDLPHDVWHTKFVMESLGSVSSMEVHVLSIPLGSELADSVWSAILQLLVLMNLLKEIFP